MTATQSGPVNAARTSSGVLGGRPLIAKTFHGGDPATVAAAICSVTTTKCQARTRLYRDGVLEREGFPVADISTYLTDESVTIWLDLRDPDREDLTVLSEEFGLHPLAVEDAGELRIRHAGCRDFRWHHRLRTESIFSRVVHIR